MDSKTVELIEIFSINDSEGGRRIKVDTTATVAGAVMIEDTTGNPITTTAGSLNVNITGGASGGGPATIADGADVAEGSTSDAAAAAGGAGTISSKLRLATSQLNTLNTTVATAANQATGNASLASIDTKLTSPISVTGPLTDVQLRASAIPVSAVALPLPTGASTEATQLAVKADLDEIKLDTDNLDVALSTRLAEATFTTRINTLGQKTMANSTPIVISSDQSAVPISGTVTITPSGVQHVIVDSGTLTTVSAVTAITNALPAGTNLLGKVSIDQTTPGTTNGVVVNSGTITTLSTLTSGNVGGFTAIVSSTVVMSVAGAYATGDYMGTTTTPQAFTNVVRTSGGTGIIKSLFISDKITTTNVAMELWLFTATFVAPTDNAAWAISDAEALTVLGVIPIATGGWYASSNNQVYSDNTLSIPIKPAATSLFYALVARGTTPAFTSSDLTINLGILQD